MLNICAVSVLDNVKISNATDAEELGKMLSKETRASKKAFVLRNSERAPFADIVVLIPGASTVMLVQCKNYGLKTSFTKHEAMTELHKMGLEKPKAEAKTSSSSDEESAEDDANTSKIPVNEVDSRATQRALCDVVSSLAEKKNVPVHVVYVLATTPGHQISQLVPKLTENETLVQMEVSTEVCYPIPMPPPGQVTAQHEKVLELTVKPTTENAK